MLLCRPAERKASAMICNALYDILINLYVEEPINAKMPGGKDARDRERIPRKALFPY